MTETESRTLTAGDLMSRDVETIRVDLPLREAAAWFDRRGVHGAPVVDDEGRCVGVLSVTDLVRWTAGRGRPHAQRPQTCTFQEPCREPGGRETTLCKLPDGACPLQHLHEMSDGLLRLACAEPNSVPVDWQVVGSEAGPNDVIRDVMTTVVLTADPETPAPELARRMLENRVHRLFVLDERRHPVGVVTASDLVRVLAHPEVAAAGGAE